MKEFVNTVFTTGAERIKHPLYGAFTISWIVFNWKSLLFVLYPMEWDLVHRINYIETEIYQTNIRIFLYVLVYPLLTAVAYITILPFPLAWIESAHTRHEVRRRNERLYNSGQALMTLNEKKAFLEEVERVRMRALRAEDELSKLKDTMSDLHAGYMDQIQSLRTRLDTATRQNQKGRQA